MNAKELFESLPLGNEAECIRMLKAALSTARIEAGKGDVSEEMPKPVFWAVHSRTGVHIGLWKDRSDADKIVTEYGGIIQPLYTATQMAAALAARPLSPEPLPTKLDWNDRDDDLSAAILASHPVKSKRYDTYARAMELVSNRHSKGALVALVNHLLIAAEPVSPEPVVMALDIKQIITNVMKAHVGENDQPIGEGGFPRVRWYNLRNELIDALSALHAPASPMPDVPRAIRAFRAYAESLRGAYATRNEIAVELDREAAALEATLTPEHPHAE